MAVAKAYTCDQCGKERQKTNHWWVGLEWETIGHPGRFSISTWDTEIPDQEGAVHLCGEECAHKALNQWLEKQRKTVTKETVQ